MDLKATIYEKGDGIGVITINRPKAFNALNSDVLDDIYTIINSIEFDDEVRCVIITGGPKAFAAGADIGFMAKANLLEIDQYILKFQRAYDSITNLTKPVIAAVGGMALGGGCELALACDIRIAVEGSKLGVPETNLGLIPGAGGTQRLARVVGIGWAKHMAMTGDPVDADTAFRIGLITQVVKPEELMDAAKKLARKLAAKAPITNKVVKQCLNTSISTDLNAGMAFERRSFNFVISTEDAKEGLNAFIEKRKPDFKGR